MSGLVDRLAAVGMALLGTTMLAGGALAQEKATIAVGISVVDVSQANNTSIPIHTGCWKKAGVDVDIQLTNANAAMQSMLTGQVQFVNMGPAAAILARAKGAPIKQVYLNIRKNYNFMVVEDKSPIKTIQEFKGKTIGVFSYGAQMVKIFKTELTGVGINPDKDVTLVETGAGAQAVAALTSGRVNIWGTWDSQIAAAENMGLKLRRFTTPEAEQLSWGSGYFVRDDYVKSKPQIISKVMRCVAEGTLFAMTNPEATVRIHWQVYPNSKPTGVSEEEAMRQALHILKTRLDFLKLAPGEKWGELPPAAATAMVDFMRASGELKGDLKVEDLYTNQFVPEVNKFDAEAVIKAAKEAK
ncbi:MAG: ABC transporter substrate-binding protein [Rhodospirillales bacterium]|nr:ABC transporter substrate-binding protein [Rhodospirillales bacterium]